MISAVDAAGLAPKRQVAPLLLRAIPACVREVPREVGPHLPGAGAEARRLIEFADLAALPPVETADRPLKDGV